MDRKECFFSGVQPCEFPEKLKKFLQEASIFYHVPYQYLVPDENIIKEDEIHFFKVDHNWVLAFLDGICSIGRNATIDYTHDTHWIVKQYEEALGSNSDVRRRLQGKGEMEEMIPLGTVTGFLLNSVISEDFRGLEFKAYGDEERNSRLQALRIEKIGPRMLMGLFRGNIRCLEIGQPPEGLHYGCVKLEEKLKKTPRDLRTGVLDNESEKVVLPLKQGIDGRILDVDQMAEKFAEILKIEKITSSELAVEMIQNTQNAAFIIREEKEY